MINLYYNQRFFMYDNLLYKCIMYSIRKTPCKLEYIEIYTKYFIDLKLVFIINKIILISSI